MALSGPAPGRPMLRRLEGEQVLWSGQPRQGLLLLPRDAVLVPLGLMWGGFALFWEATALRMAHGTLFPLWGLPFLLSGLYIAAGRFVLDAWLRRNLSYAVTDRRVLIRRSGPFPRVTALGFDQLHEVTLLPGIRGGGTVRFGTQPPLPEPEWSWRGSRNGTLGLGAWTPALDPAPQFLAIADADTVFALVQRLMQGGADARRA